MNKTNKGILILAGSTLAMTSIQSHEPTTVKGKPSADVVSRYLTTHTSRYKYDPSINRNDWSKSEQRKQELLSDIRSIRAQIRERAQRMLIEQDAQNEKVVVTLLGKMHTRTCHRIYEVMSKRSEEIKVPRKYLSEEKILKRNGILVVEMEDIS